MIDVTTSLCERGLHLFFFSCPIVRIKLRTVPSVHGTIPETGEISIEKKASYSRKKKKKTQKIPTKYLVVVYTMTTSIVVLR